ncbi:unnamed protein product [Didymodactylos carnosus]|uniref:Riboflavin transporter n=1 Tax=Didymodactylos carnosus TaxID=1234261 RepID=A0A815DDT4_9BILA|nr:unnamed protein product [Didymodactylos carnosus]CAF1299504.1 unnamed protein product [Didymodactylos carnosus]CAF3909137.1 unnamed protein product [Didymodactylos carnosus]CAF4121008.1 unnamed protein product [Didymodactylos carnosus]
MAILFSKKPIKCSVLLIYFMIILFGSATWLTWSGVWTELPLLVPILPEGWQLPSIFNLVTNISNIGPFIIVLIRIFKKDRMQSYEVPLNLFILVFGAIVLIFLAFLWHKTINNHSFYLLFLSFCLSFVDCTSTVTFLPYCYRYEKFYLNAYFIGEALSSLLPAILGLIQGAGEIICTEKYSQQLNETLITQTLLPARYSIRIYFFCLLTIILMSLIGFIVLLYTKTGKVNKELSQIENENANKMTRKEFWWSKHGLLMLILFWSTIFNYGALPALITYSVYPYGLNAKMSPCSPLVDRVVGKYIVAGVWTLTALTYYCQRISIGNYFREISGHRGLFWFGAISQFASLIGAIFIYLLTSVFNEFKERDVCKHYAC